MAITTKLELEGEQEYKKSLSELVAKNKELASEMKTVKASFSENTSEQEKARQKAEVLNKQIQNQTAYVEQLQAKMATLDENSKEAFNQQDKINKATAALAEMKKELAEIPNAAEIAGKKIEDIGDKVSKVGDGMTKYLSAPLAAIGTAGVAAFNEVDAAMDTVTTKTGATGESLKNLQESVKNLATSMPTDFQSAADAVGEINTRFGLAGDACEELAQQFLEFSQLNNTDVSSSIDLVQKDLEAFGLSADDAGTMLDVLNRTSQNTGVSVETLSDGLVKNASAFQEMGLSAEQSIALMGQLEKSGASSQDVLNGLRKALKNAAEDGVPLNQALSDLQDEIVSNDDSTQALSDTYDLFGRSGDQVYQAIKSGALNFEELSSQSDILADSMGSVSNTFDETVDPIDEMKAELNKLKYAGAEYGATILKNLLPALQKIGKAAANVSEWYGNLSEDQQDLIIKMGLVTSAAGPVLKIAGSATTEIGKVVGAIGKLAKAHEASAAATDVATSCSKAFTAALNINPITLAIGAIGSLAAGITIYVKSIQDAVIESNEFHKKAKDGIEEVKTATDDLNSTMKDAASSIEDVGAKSESMDALVDRLDELASKTEKSTSEQAEMKGIVDELNSVYPDLALEIDSTTGSISKSTKEIKTYIKQASQLEKLKAYSEAASDAWEAVAKAQVAATKNQNLIDDISKEIESLEEQYKAIDTGWSSSFNPSLFEANVEAKNLRITIGDLKRQLDDLTESQGTLNQAVDDATEEANFYTAAEQGLADQTGTTAAEIEESGNTVTTTSEQVSNSISSTGDVAEQTTTDMISYAEMWGQAETDSATATTEAEEEKQSAYQDTYDAAYDSYTRQLNLQEGYQEGTSVTAAEMLENLQSQAQAYSNYSDNMTYLQEALNTSTDQNAAEFVNSLAQQGIDSAAEVQALVDGLNNGSITVDGILSTYGNYKENAEKAAHAQAEASQQLQNTIDNNIEALRQGRAKAQAEASEGTEIPISYANSIGRGVPVVQQSIGRVNSVSTIGIRNMVQTSVQLAGKGGTDTSNALGTGLSNGTGSVKNGIGALANEVAAGAQRISGYSGIYRNKGATMGANYAQGVSSQASNAGSSASYVASYAAGRFSGYGGSAYTWGHNLGTNFANGISSTVNTVANAALRVAQQAGIYLHHSTPDKGPLKDDDKWGGEFVGNFVSGIYSFIPQVRKAAIAMADATVLDVQPMSAQAMTSRTATGATSTLRPISVNVNQTIYGGGADAKEIAERASIEVERGVRKELATWR